MDQHVHPLREHLVEPVDQVAPYDVHEGVGRCRTGRHDTVGEHQPVDRHTAERPCPEQCGGDPLSQEAEATRDDDPHAFSPR